MHLGPYEVVSELGRGGAGIVYRGRDPTGRDVAIKVLHGTGAIGGKFVSPRGESALARFERERRLLADLASSDGFVPLLDAGETPAGPYIVMGYVGGGTLRARLSKRGALPIDEAATLARDLARALGRAHAKGILHRDLKPENVLFTEAGVPLVADLGLAKHFRTDTPGASKSVQLSRTGEFRGTAGYMAPEQMRDSSTAGPAADVFALGAILYECLTGVPAFEAESMLEVMSRVELGEYVPVRKLRREVPSWLQAIVERALEHDPAKRWADGAALARALEARVAPPARSAPVIAGVAVVIVVVAMGIARGVSKDTTVTPSPPATPPPRVERPRIVEKPRAVEKPGVKPPLSPTAVLGISSVLRDEATTHVAFARDGKLAVTSRIDGLVRSFDPRTGKTVREVKAHRKPAETVAISVDGRFAISGGHDKAAQLIDLARHEVVRTLKLPSLVRSAAFSPDGKRALLGTEGKTGRLWDLESGAELGTIHHDGPIHAVAFSPDGLLAISGSADRTAKVWSIGGRPSVVATLAGHGDSVFAVALSGDGMTALTGAADSVARVFDVRSSTLVRKLEGHENSVTSVELAHDARLALTGSADRRHKLWEVAGGRALRTFERPNLRALALGFSKDGQLVDLVSGREPTEAQGHVTAVRTLTFSSDGNILATGSDDGEAKIHELPARRTFSTATPGVKLTAIVFADGTRLITAGEDGSLRTWNTMIGVGATFLGHTNAVTAVAIPADGRGLLSASADSVRLFDLKTRKELASETLSDAEPLVAIARDGTVCAVAGRAGVRFVTLGEKGGPPPIAAGEPLGALALSFDGARVVAAARDKPVVRAWETRSGSEVRAFSPHATPVRLLAVAPDGDRLLSVAEDKSIVVSSLGRGEVLERVELDSDEATALAFSPAGRAFAVGTARGFTYLYDLGR